MVHAVSRAVEGVHELGHPGPVVLKTDNEAALLALREAIMAELHEGAIPVQPPRSWWQLRTARSCSS